MASSPEQRTSADTPTPADVADWVLLHRDDVRRFLLGILRNPDQADDALQATLALALEKGTSAREATFRGWLFQVARNEALRVRRRQAVELRGAETLARSARTAPDLPPDSQLLRDESVAQVRQAIDTMPEALKQVVLDRFRDDKTFAQIAHDRKLPLGTVLTRMRRATHLLRDALSATRDPTP
jgi:RNA polymerase sigma-70 factor (ECF subfamily)